MDKIKKKFEKLSSDQFKCKVVCKSKNDAGDETEKPCDNIVVIGKDSMWNLKRHMIRNHPDVIEQIEAAERGIDVANLLIYYCRCVTNCN